MNEPDPSARKLQRRGSEMAALRSAISQAMQAGRSACSYNPNVGAEIAPLLSRLEEIREELDRLERRPASPLSGELYPFWIELARKGRD